MNRYGIIMLHHSNVMSNVMKISNDGCNHQSSVLKRVSIELQFKINMYL